MLRWIGAFLILGGGLLARRTILEGERRAQRTRRALASAFDAMEAEIRLLLTPLPSLLRRDYGKDAKEFFDRTARELGSGAALSSAWRRAAEPLPLQEDERETVAALGARLCGGEDAACAALALASAALRRSYDESEARRRERERLVTTLCVSAGLLLCILLL